LLAALLWVAGDRHVMCGQTRSRLTRTAVILTMLTMFGAAIGMFVL
jgi:hypothetical protein